MVSLQHSVIGAGSVPVVGSGIGGLGGLGGLESPYPKTVGGGHFFGSPMSALSSGSHPGSLPASGVIRDGSVPCAVYHFLLPTSHPSLSSSASSASLTGADSASAAAANSAYDDTPYLHHGNYRVGLIAAFHNMDQLEVHFLELLNIVRKADEELNGADSMWSQGGGGNGGGSGGGGGGAGALGNGYGSSNGAASDDSEANSGSDANSPQPPPAKGRSGSSASATASAAANAVNSTTGRTTGTLLEEIEPIYIINITIKCDGADDSLLTKQFEDFCARHRSELEQAAIRRMTFVVCDRYRFPRYFTFRYRSNFVEDPIYRHLEPALAFQLEINRLRNYDLEAVPTASQNKMHLYLGKAKVRAPGQSVTDFRFFVRTIIRHSDLITKEASYEFLQNEGMFATFCCLVWVLIFYFKLGERLLLEAMDELEVAFTHHLAPKTDCNHIFLNFVPKVTMDPAKVPYV